MCCTDNILAPKTHQVVPQTNWSWWFVVEYATKPDSICLKNALSDYKAYCCKWIRHTDVREKLTSSKMLFKKPYGNKFCTGGSRQKRVICVQNYYTKFTVSLVEVSPFAAQYPLSCHVRPCEKGIQLNCHITYILAYICIYIYSLISDACVNSPYIC